MMAYAASGIQLLHYTVFQYQETTPVSMSQLKPGDLIYYAFNFNDISTIHHVALYVGNGLMIEAPHTGAWVRVSPIGRPDLFAAGRPPGVSWG